MEISLGFSKIAQKALENDGAKILHLPLLTIAELKKRGQKFQYMPYGDFFQTARSTIKVAAIYPDPKRLCVPGTYDLEFAAQTSFIKDDIHVLRKRLGVEGIDEVMGEASDVITLLREYLNETGVYLLGSNYGNRMVRTKTGIFSKKDRNKVIVGDHTNDGILVDSLCKLRSDQGLWALRLIVPKFSPREWLMSLGAR